MQSLRAKAPSLAVLLFAAVPAAVLYSNAMGLASGSLRPGAPYFTGFYALGCCFALMPLAARVRYAFEMALGITMALFVLGGLAGRVTGALLEFSPLDEESWGIEQSIRTAYRTVLIFAALGLGAAFLARDAYLAPLQRETFHARVRGGLAMLLRPGAGSAARAALGVAAMLAAPVVAALPLAHPMEGGAVWVPRWVFLAALALLASAVVLPDEPDRDGLPIIRERVADDSASMSGPLRRTDAPFRNSDRWRGQASPSLVGKHTGEPGTAAEYLAQVMADRARQPATGARATKEQSSSGSGASPRVSSAVRPATEVRGAVPRQPHEVPETESTRRDGPPTAAASQGPGSAPSTERTEIPRRLRDGAARPVRATPDPGPSVDDKTRTRR